MGEWTRCANTGFYRKPWDTLDHPLAWWYCNPLTWTYITAAPQLGIAGTDGLTAVVQRKAPRYSWEALQAGVPMVAEEAGLRQEILRYTHGWAADLKRAQDIKLAPRDQARIFETAPYGLRSLVLDGVRALVIGTQELALDESEEAVVHGKTVLVAQRDTDAERNLDALEETFPGFQRSIVTRDPSRGLDEALSEFGIHEC